MSKASLNILFAAMLGGALIAWLFGKELSWDLANYHFYNPYAFLHARYQLDYWPTSFIQQYLNPALDFVCYHLIKHTHPLIAILTLGAIQGINFWLLFLIAKLFTTKPFEIITAILIALCGSFGPIALPLLGTFQNDNVISLFVLASIYAYLRFIFAYSANSSLHFRLLFAAGLSLGLATGLKLTAGIFVIGMIMTTLLLPISIRNRLLSLLALGIAILIGIVISSGFWMYHLWVQHANPFFPFLNHLFHSPDFAQTNWRDTRFLPKSIWQYIFFPFFFSWDGRTSDYFFQDFRLMLTYILFIANIPHFVKNKIPLTHACLFVFFITSYIIWMCYFSIARYIVTLELLSPLLIYLLLQTFIREPLKLLSSLIIVFSTLIFLMRPMQLPRSHNLSHSYFNVQLPKNILAINHAIVFTAYPAYVIDADPKPQNYLIPYFPSNWHFVGIPFIHKEIDPDNSIAAKIKSTLQTAQVDLFALTAQVNMHELLHTLKNFGLVQHGDCMPILSDRQKITQQGILLCPLRKI